VNDKLLVPNSFQTPNALVDKAMPIVSGPAFKVLIAITRLTLGWEPDKAVEIGIDGLRKMTGLSRPSIVGAGKELTKLELILVKKSPRNSRTPNQYQLNLDLTTGQLVKNIDQLKLLPSLTSKGFLPKLVNGFNSLILNPRNPKEERAESDKPIPDHLPSFSNSKKRKQSRAPAGVLVELQPVVSRVVTRINELAGTHYRDDKPAALRNLIARLNDGRTEAECLAVVEGRHAVWAGNDKMLEYFRPSTLFAETHFEDYLQDAQRRGTGNGHAKPTEAKDLGNGLVEVDGLKMTRETYERKHARAAG
jgi:uncharacterized phage protein (TIGR02220 family)